MIFTNNFLKNDSFFYWKNDFIERTNLLNERFYWINGFTEGLFGEITNKRDLFNQRQFLRTNEINFHWSIKKYEHNGSFMNNEQTKWKKNRMRPSLIKTWSLNIRNIPIPSYDSKHPVPHKGELQGVPKNMGIQWRIRYRLFK